MNRRENTIRAIEFRGPERVPLNDEGRYPALGCGWSYFNGLDPVKSPRIAEIGGEGVDEWGCYWTMSGDYTMGMTLNRPLADWKDFETNQFPNPHNPKRWIPARIMRRVKEARGEEEQYMVGGVHFTLFERMYMLRGFNEIFVDLYFNRSKAEALADRILEFDIGLVEEWAEFGVDGIMMSDDWGTNIGLLISPKLWREFFKPRYKKLFDAVHKRGMHTHMHSDGQILEIIPDWIEVGLDVINLPQHQSLFGIDNLGKRFGGKVCFSVWGVDNMTTLLHGTMEDIRREVKQLIKALGSFKGGLIVNITPFGNPTRIEHYKKMLVTYKTFKEFEKYPLEI